MNARRCTLLLVTASSLVLASCAIKQPPVGADIMPESARAKIPGSWAGPHRSGEVVPELDPQFWRSGAERVGCGCRGTESRSQSRRRPRGSIARCCARCRIITLPADRDEGIGRAPGTGLSGDLGRDINPPSFGSAGTEDSGGAGLDTSTDSIITALGIWASQPVPHGRPTCGGAFARKKLPRRLKATRWKPTTNLPGNHSPLRWRARISLRSKPRNRKRTHRKRSISTMSIRSSLTSANSRVLPVTSTCRKLHRAPPPPRMRSTPHRRRGRRQSALLRSSPVAILPADLMCDVLSPANREAVPAGLPAQILERRPDLIASERRFAAAFHRVNEARTARLPRFVLSATSGLGTADLDGVGALDALVWSFAGGITQPIFFGGELKAAQDIRTAEQKAAAASLRGPRVARVPGSGRCTRR